MSTDNTSGLGRLRTLGFTSGAGTTAWGGSELVQEPIISSMFANSEILAVIVPFIVLAIGVATALDAIGVLAPMYQTACTGSNNGGD